MKTTKYLAKCVCVSLVGVLLLIALVEIPFRLLYRRASLLDKLVHTKNKDEFMYLSTAETTRTLKSGCPPSPVDILLKQDRQTDSKPFRIVMFGGSAAAGYTYLAPMSFSHFLHYILAKRWPDARIQTFNLACFAQTYSFAVRAARDARHLRPDCFIVYLGHNELYPQNLYWTLANKSGARGFISRLTSWLETQSRAFAVMLDSREQAPEHTRPRESFKWDQHIDDAVRHYEQCSGQLYRISRRAGAQIIFVTPVRNLRDFGPNIDDHCLPVLTESQLSDLIDKKKEKTPTECFRIGRYYAAKGKNREAKAWLEQASDRSIRMGRIHSRMLAIVRDTPTLFPGALSIDMGRVLREKIGHDIPGDEQLIDWCHLRLETNYLPA